MTTPRHTALDAFALAAAVFAREAPNYLMSATTQPRPSISTRSGPHSRITVAAFGSKVASNLALTRALRHRDRHFSPTPPASADPGDIVSHHLIAAVAQARLAELRRTPARSRAPTTWCRRNKLQLLAALVVLAIASCCLLASAAQAASLVFINGGNVWLANPDGSGQYQVTLDGTPSEPYRSPSQADDGTIVALRHGRLFRMKQNGAWLNEPISTAAPGSGPLHPAVSPDGRLVAFDYVTAIPRPPSQGGGFKKEVIYTYSDRFTDRTEIDPAGFSFSDPSWLDNGRTLLFYGMQVWTDAPDPADEVEWWTDLDHDGFEQLQDGEAAGSKVVLVRGANRETLQFYERQGSGYDFAPAHGCTFSEPTGEFADPTLSPGAATVAWHENDGIWVSQVPAGTGCDGAAPRLAIAGASEPDFGPADVNPSPKACCEPPTDTTPPTMTLTIKSELKLRALLGGLKVRYRCSERCSASATLRLDPRVARRLRLPRTVATGSSAAATAGTLVLTPTRRAKRKLRRLRKVTLTLLVTARDGAGNATSKRRRMMVRR
jgi:hypothetical protein